MDLWRDEEPSLTLKLVEGTIIVLDLDKLSEIIREKGWSEYRPNPLTGLLSRLVEQLVIKWHGVIVYGLDWERGTEEAIIEIPYTDPSEIKEDLERIFNEIRENGGSISIVAIKDYVLAKPARDRYEAYYGSPGRRRAVKILKAIKRRGGGKIVLL